MEGNNNNIDRLTSLHTGKTTNSEESSAPRETESYNSAVKSFRDV
jgi:hypothetical protein